jgi:hypothetical protein
MKKPTTKQLVVFSIMMQKGNGIMGKAPTYIKEKMEKVFENEHAERYLDAEGVEIFNTYIKEWNGYIRD